MGEWAWCDRCQEEYWLPMGHDCTPHEERVAQAEAALAELRNHNRKGEEETTTSE